VDCVSLELNLKISVGSGGGIGAMHGFNLSICVIIACVNTATYSLLLMSFLPGICGASFL